MNINEMYTMTGEEIFERICEQLSSPKTLEIFKKSSIGKMPLYQQQHWYISLTIDDVIKLLTSDKDNYPTLIDDLNKVKLQLLENDAKYKVYVYEDKTDRIAKIDRKIADINKHHLEVDGKIKYLNELADIINTDIELMRLGIDV